MNTYIALVVLENEVRLCLAQADDMGKARDIVEMEYGYMKERGDFMHIQMFEAKAYHQFEELSINWL